MKAPLNLLSSILTPEKESQQRYKIFCLPVGYSGCAFWRYRLPFAKLKKLSSRLDIAVADNPDKTFRMADIQAQVGDSQLVSIQAPGYKDALTLMKVYHAEGKMVVIDYDDYSFDLSPGNLRYAELGIREQTVRGPDGKIIFDWKDGQNGFDLKANIGKFEAFKACLREADLVTTTTKYLADKFRQYSKNVRVCPNSVDFDLWKPLPRPPELKDEIRIGWFGGDSHFVDLKVFQGLLPRLCKAYPQVKIVLQCPPVPEWHKFFKDVPENQMEWHNWADLRHYTLFFASRHWDIGLCPLDDDEFNRCKSSIKFYEFASIGAAVVAQNMLPYKQDIEHGVNGFLASTEDQWFERIATLIENKDLRHKMAFSGFEYVHKNYNLDANCRIWEKAYVDCIEGGGRLRSGLDSTP